MSQINEHEYDIAIRADTNAERYVTWIKSPDINVTSQVPTVVLLFCAQYAPKPTSHVELD